MSNAVAANHQTSLLKVSGLFVIAIMSEDAGVTRMVRQTTNHSSP